MKQGKPSQWGVFALLVLMGTGGCNSDSSQGEKQAGSSRVSEVVLLTASDGVKVYCDRYRPPEKARSVALLFHQAGSNAGEYAEIAPRLVQRGMECLAVDLRAGGTMWERDNRTQKASGRSDWKYEDAYQDMLAAYDWAKARGFVKIVVWGSSYSASLVLRLASERPVSAVVSFSPGEYFDDKNLVAGWNMKVDSPCLFGFTQKEAGDGGISLYQKHKDTPARKLDVVALHEAGVHGCSTLIAEKSTPIAAGYYWKMVWTLFETTLIVKPVSRT